MVAPPPADGEPCSTLRRLQSPHVSRLGDAEQLLVRAGEAAAPTAGKPRMALAERAGLPLCRYLVSRHLSPLTQAPLDVPLSQVSPLSALQGLHRGMLPAQPPARARLEGWG